MTKKFDYLEHYKIDAEEFDYFEERTGATEHDERRVHEFITSKIKVKPKSILDVGAGSGWVAKHFEADESINVVSLDISKINVKKAKEIVNSLTHSPVVADSFHLPFMADSFDIVIASEIIEHVIDPENFVKELLRVTNTSGKLIVTTPYKEKLRFNLCIHCNQKTPVHAHIHSFDENKLMQYSINENLKPEFEIFGNKLLIFLRTYLLLKYFPFTLWKFVDNLFNLLKNLPAHIIIEYKK